MLALALLIRTKQLSEQGVLVTVQYTFEALLSGQHFDIDVRDSATKYYVALTADAHLDNVIGKVWIQQSLSSVGLVYRAYSLQLRFCSIEITGFTSSFAYLAKLAETITLYQSQVVFRNTSNAIVDYLPSTTLLSLTSKDKSSIIQSIPHGKKEIPPCVSCVKPSQQLADNCFGCTFGFTPVGKTCTCAYNGSSLNEELKRCEHKFNDLISDGTQNYFSACVSNTQITANFNGTITTTNFAVLKNDSCGISNLFIDGAAFINGNVSYLSGLVRYVSRSLNNVFQSIYLGSNSTYLMASLICNQVTANATISAITLNGNLQNMYSTTKISPVGGIVSLADGGFAITIQTIRVLGMQIMVYGTSFASLFVGQSQGATLSFSDILITQKSNDNYTQTPVSAAGYDFNDVTFVCKDKATSQELKDAMKLQLFLKLYDFQSSNTTLSYQLRQSGGLIGGCNGSTVTVSNFVMSVYINGSYHSSGSSYSIGYLVGNLTSSSFTINGAYLRGKIIGYNMVGVIGQMLDSSFDSVMAADIFLDGNSYGGIIGTTVNGVISTMRLALNMSADSYLYYRALFGQSTNLNATIQEAFGYSQSTSSSSVYAHTASSLKINGVSYSSMLNSVPNLYINQC